MMNNDASDNDCYSSEDDIPIIQLLKNERSLKEKKVTPKKGLILSSKPFIFYSGAKEDKDNSHQFSNLYESEVILDGYNFPSAEHAFQSQKYPDVRHRFAMGGDLSTFSGLSYFYPRMSHDTDPKKMKNTAEGKTKYWSKKNMVGIVAKMCQKNHQKAVLPPPKPITMEMKLLFFRAILLSKFNSNTVLKQRLVETGNRYLLEFCRGAQRREKLGGDPERWGGIAVQTEEGFILFGDNTMGNLLMELRSQIINS
jgi:predicted NAD-dependent protein-ADP-ribosyltransferase YbiA (DUF1768 family)